MDSVEKTFLRRSARTNKQKPVKDVDDSDMPLVDSPTKKVEQPIQTAKPDNSERKSKPKPKLVDPPQAKGDNEDDPDLLSVDDICGRILDLHNKVRRQMGLPTLELDEELNYGAQTWADHCTGEDNYKHSHTPNRGESWALHCGDNCTLEGLFNQWYKERNNYEYDVYPDCAINPRKDVGHYTQIIWKTTKKLGVGLATRGDKTFLVCQYYPCGNIKGYTAY